MSGLNDIYGAALTVPQRPAAEVGDLPSASVQAASTPHEVGSLPASGTVPVSPVNPVATFSSALMPPGFPSYLVEPPSPAVSVRSGSSAIFIKVVTMDGSQYRVRNHRTGAVTLFVASSVVVAVALKPNDWNLLTFEVQGDLENGVKNLDINEGGTRISGSFVLHASRYFPRYGTLSGATYLAVNLLDLQLPASTGNLNYWNLGRTNLSAQLIDRLLITADNATNPTGALAYSNNPGSPDALRSTAAMAALNSLLAKGWTITR